MFELEAVPYRFRYTLLYKILQKGLFVRRHFFNLITKESRCNFYIEIFLQSLLLNPKCWIDSLVGGRQTNTLCKNGYPAVDFNI